MEEQIIAYLEKLGLQIQSPDEKVLLYFQNNRNTLTSTTISYRELPMEFISEKKEKRSNSLSTLNSSLIKKRTRNSDGHSLK